MNFDSAWGVYLEDRAVIAKASVNRTTKLEICEKASDGNPIEQWVYAGRPGDQVCVARFLLREDAEFYARAHARWPVAIADARALVLKMEFLLKGAAIAGAIASKAENAMAYELAKSFLKILATDAPVEVPQ